MLCLLLVARKGKLGINVQLRNMECYDDGVLLFTYPLLPFITSRKKVALIVVEHICSETENLFVTGN